MSNIYNENGYNSREEYLEELADEYGIPYETVYCLWELYGDEEAFDGLVSACEDAETLMASEEDEEGDEEWD